MSCRRAYLGLGHRKCVYGLLSVPGKSVSPLIGRSRGAGLGALPWLPGGEAVIGRSARRRCGSAMAAAGRNVVFVTGNAKKLEEVGSRELRGLDGGGHRPGMKRGVRQPPEGAVSRGRGEASFRVRRFLPPPQLAPPPAVSARPFRAPPSLGSRVNAGAGWGSGSAGTVAARGTFLMLNLSRDEPRRGVPLP
ncbi:hypothetical protein KIL84_006470 [Mauremys mutica]|uniref:Uncharacterized protein n=1 Tax=Mauremys mutica TaxID=74926 RepID=A0A9D3X174_9SAUR|nr:hypothetical protein KIL84_006470 [Mauremys mutica]